ncbi:MAG: beta-ketoacyl synthase N-terminal-like domain-containing protein, partial [Planctomycetota bacterium]
MQIAIVGMACRLPGADDLDAYWTLIRDGVSTAQPLPDSRFDRSLYYDPKRGVQNRSYSDIACLVNEHAQGQYFDQLPQAVRDCPEVAYRTLCDVAAEALADAQLELSPAHRRSGGVYLGHARSSGLAGDLAYGTCIAQTARLLDRVDQFRQLDLEHDHLIRELVSEVRREYPHRDPNGRPRLGPHAATTLLAETFAIDGPHMTFNSACASSLSALYQASLALQHGRIDVALVGGASVCHFETLLLFSQAQSLSGVMSRPFDHDADGLVVGEGYAVVILKTLEKAIQDGDRVHAVIRGIGTSSDGKGRSLWAPRKQGQVAAIRRAYPTGLPASSVQYIEAHATSTQLGDATEVAALTEAFDVPDGSTIPIGSVKANIGHTLETAGLAGLLKVVLSMRNETIGPAANLNRLNQKVDWESLPFYVPRHAEPWESPADSQPRRAAVNAFGIGGLNVHVVVEEHKPVHPIVAPTPRVRASSHGVETRPDPVAVVGRGTVLPGALNVDAFAEMLTSGMDPKGVTDDHRLCSDDYLDRSGPMHWHTTNHLSGQVKGFQYDWQTHKIPPKQIAHASPLQFMILDAVEQAFAEAGIDPRSADRSRIGVVVGSSFGGEFSTQLLMGLRLPEFQKRLIAALSRRGIPTEQCAAVSEQYAVELVKHLPALLDETGSFTSSSLASRITKAFDLMGGGVAVDAGNCGSAAALACCVDQLQSHDCDMMICVGGQEDLSPTFFERLSLAGLLSSGSPKSPFDTAADGTVPGEGCAAVLLMRHVDARRRQKQAFALIRGIGASTADSQPEACEQAVRD